MTEHVIHFHCQIDQGTSERFRDCCLDAIDEGASSLLLNLSTTGGSSNFGFTLYTFLKALPVPLCAINAGNIESMGIIMFLAANRRITTPHSRFDPPDELAFQPKLGGPPAPARVPVEPG